MKIFEKPFYQQRVTLLLFHLASFLLFKFGSSPDELQLIEGSESFSPKSLNMEEWMIFF
jgi:hypothetical protein